MSFPQELIEEILSYLSSRDKRSLRNCSLVAKSWINPSRRRLFKTVVIGTRDLQSWLDKISPSNTELLCHVRSFCFSGLDWSSFARFTDIKDLYVYFRSFRRLHTIRLSGVHVLSDVPERIEMFSPVSKPSRLSFSPMSPSRGARSQRLSTISQTYETSNCRVFISEATTETPLLYPDLCVGNFVSTRPEWRRF